MDVLFGFSRGYLHQLLYVLLLPAFFICFCFLYNPFDIQGFYEVGGKSFAFHLLMLTCILIVVLALTRLILTAVNAHTPLYPWHYLIWCLGEIVITAFFAALYTDLFYGNSNMPYFLALSHCMKFFALILVYPYVFLFLLRLVTIRSEALSSRIEPKEETLAKFYDEHKRLKLTIDPSAILYISAESNYINIHYLENERHKEFLLRNSMKSLEQVAFSRSLVRCHRSYYVNPKHIKVLSRSKEGIITAEFMQEGVKPIPVSKQYYGSLSEIL